jgi:hypothetical protein
MIEPTLSDVGRIVTLHDENGVTLDAGRITAFDVHHVFVRWGRMDDHGHPAARATISRMGPGRGPSP